MVVAGPGKDTYAAVNNTADVDALDVQNAGLYIMGGNSSTELVVDSENPEVASRVVIFFFPLLCHTPFFFLRFRLLLVVTSVSTASAGYLL